VCNDLSPNFYSILVGGPPEIKKTWVDIPNVGQKGVIQYGVQDGRRTVIPNITQYSSPLIFFQRLKLATTNSVCSLCFPRPIIKLHPKENVGVALG